jgi:hypothetical protein
MKQIAAARANPLNTGQLPGISPDLPHQASVSMLPTARSPREVVLLLGWTVGPFVLTLLTVGLLAALGWPRHSALRYFYMPGSLILGTVCFVLHTRPRGLQWLILLPYVLGYYVAALGVFIVAAISAGAPK